MNRERARFSVCFKTNKKKIAGTAPAVIFNGTQASLAGHWRSGRQISPPWPVPPKQCFHRGYSMSCSHHCL